MGNVKGGSSRARNILQHGLIWMKQEAFADTLPDGGPAEAMLKNLIRMYDSAPPEAYSRFSLKN